MTSQLRRRCGNCRGVPLGWSNEHDVTAYWDYQPGRELGTTRPVNYSQVAPYNITTRHSGIDAGAAETVSTRHNQQWPKNKLNCTMGSMKWATGNKPTRDLEQPAKNWEHVQPTRNGEQLLNGKLGTTKFELGTTNTSGQLTGTLETQSQCIYSRVPNRGNTRYAHSTMAKRHHAGLPAPGTAETASTRHNNNKSKCTTENSEWATGSQ
ncbi:hypothetical protein B0H13DRAFT_1933473 [Mycena leptocephala]|nr:hypothetical protein B0H13DRAFT_1933473 [Mycena leptocephala]